MSTTTGLIKKAKDDLQKLRMEFLKAGDDKERNQVKARIERLKALLDQLGAEHG